MKKTRLLAWFAMCATLFSFTPIPFGGEHFQIYVNNKMVLQQIVARQYSAPSLTLDEAAMKGQIAVLYDHCGQIGKSRSLSIKNDENKTLKEWNFKDTGESKVTLEGKDIAALFKNEATRLNLYYSSKEIPDGRKLATIVLAGSNTARKQ